MRGTVTKKGNRWYIVYTIGVLPNGKRKQKWESGFRTKREAELALAKRLVEIGTNSYVEPTTLLFKDFVEAWATDKENQVRPTTWRSYSWNLRVYILPQLGSKKLKDLTAPQIQHFYSVIRQMPRSDGKPGNISERTILHVHLLLHQIFKRAVKWGYIGMNPCDLVDKPKVEEPDLNVWTLDEGRTFLKFAEANSLYPLFLLLFTTGMRIGEVLGLRWQDINFDENTLSVTQQVVFVKGGYKIGPPKTKAGRRTIDINAQVTKALLDHRIHWNQLRELGGEHFQIDLDLVFCTKKGTPIFRSNVTKAYNEIVEKAGLKRIRIHDIRHTHASLLLEQGESIKVVQERIGHEKADVLLNRYAHVLPRMQRKAVDTFGARLFDTPDSV
ncbi:site-specific integrase [Alicyclobacillus fastidiosus]|nr:site-specific integrase [Alicyclobacillus fastidiosus]